VRQLAWLNVTPKDHKKSRIKALVDDGLEPDMPETDCLHLVGYLESLGFDSATSREIEAWCNMGGVELQAWEFEFLLKLSKEFGAQLHDLEAPAPYVSEQQSEHNAKIVSDKLRGFLLNGSSRGT